jgi:hypothetical protein
LIGQVSRCDFMRSHAQRLVHLSIKSEEPTISTIWNLQRHTLAFFTIHILSISEESNDAVRLNDYVAATIRAPIRRRQIESTALVQGGVCSTCMNEYKLLKPRLTQCRRALLPLSGLYNHQRHRNISIADDERADKKGNWFSVLLFLSFMQTERYVYLLRLIPIQWSFTPTKKLSGHGLSLMVLMQDSDVLTSFYIGSFFVTCLLTCIELLI